MSELKQVLKERDFHQNFVGTMFLKPPEGNFSRVTLFGEISSLSDFLDDSVYMFYEFALPYGWKIDNENSNAKIYASEGYKEENLNYLKSISQVSTGYVNPNAYSFKRSKNVVVLCCPSIISNEPSPLSAQYITLRGNLAKTVVITASRCFSLSE